MRSPGPRDNIGGKLALVCSKKAISGKVKRGTRSKVCDLQDFLGGKAVVGENNTPFNDS